MLDCPGQSKSAGFDIKAEEEWSMHPVFVTSPVKQYIGFKLRSFAKAMLEDNVN